MNNGTKMTADEEDIYHLHTFPPTPYCYNVSPFAIKLESFFRINKIPYKNVYTTQFGSKRMIPYVKVNGEKEICDSNVIMAYLRHNSTDISDLNDEQRAVSHSAIRMLEEHTTQIGFYYRYGLHMPEFCDKLDIGNRFGSDTILFFFKKFQPPLTLKKTKYRGLSRHSDEELWRFSFDDLQALSHLLCNKRFFFGDDVPTSLDCAVFGHLVQFLYIPIDFPQKQYLHESCPNLVRFVEEFKRVYWPDWEEKCKAQPNMKYDKDGVKKSEFGRKVWVCAGIVAVGAYYLYPYLKGGRK